MSFRRALRLVAAAALVAPLSLAEVRSDEPSRPIEFNRDVRPILSDHCFACHGPDANRREADLRLDTQAGLTGDDGASGVVRPGAPDDSELWHRIVASEPDERMPPPEFAKDLSAEQIDTLRAWIEQGAEWEGHWSFQPIRRPDVPTVADEHGFVRNEIDAFILAGLQGTGLQPSPPADRRTLIRRLSFDLTGLPPTVEEVERFVADQSPEAYERLVESYLESPHYGERMAMIWLDLVRYADSAGYHGDQEVSVSPFRDYVIDSFNRNVPFDRFTVEQLAGDLLPDPSMRERIASGYNRLGMMSAEGGVQPKEYLAKYIAERVRNLGGTWMGVTLGCCECHDHKYDPFSMRDFYSFEAFFADIREQGLYGGAVWDPEMKVPTAEQQQRLDELNRAIGLAQRELETETPELIEARRAWEGSQPSWTILDPVSVTSEHGTTLTRQSDGSWLASGTAPASDTYRLSLEGLPVGTTAIRLEVLPDESLPAKGPGRASNGNFVLSEFVARSLPTGDSTESPIALKFASAAATFEQTGAAGGNPYGRYSIASAIDADVHGPIWGWAVMEQVGRPHAAVFRLAEPLTELTAARVEIELQQIHNGTQHTIGRFRVSATTAPAADAASPMPEAIAAILAIPEADRVPAQAKELATYFRSIAPQLAEVREALATATAERDRLDASIVRTLVTETVEPRMVRLLKRGNWMDESGPEMSPAVPEWLGGPAMPSDRRATRLDLARWLTHPDHPLTSRVFANRMWKQFFGTGLSRSLDDLGSQGEWPSHPELLDWLAVRFVDSGWDVKQLARTIVLSGTYRQSSLSDPYRDEIDPFDRLLSRQSRHRLDAEMVRDNALRISGLLVDRIGGRSVRPYQPKGYWAYLNFPTREYQPDSGEALYRRGLYTHWQRQYLHPSLLAFDAPSREECAADRPRSNTPLQSLVLLNDPIYVEAARVLAERTLREGGEGFADRLAFAYRRTLSREPRPEEVEVLGELLEKHLATYRADTASAEKLISVGEAPRGGDLDPAELAAWTSIARTLLNLHETITRN